MRLVVTGAAGMLGSDEAAAAEHAGHEVVALARADLDVRDAAAVRAALAAARPDAVVNCAAFTDVDGAEADEAGATALNGAAAGHVAAAAHAAGAGAPAHRRKPNGAGSRQWGMNRTRVMRKSTRSLVAGVASLSFAAFLGCAAVVLPIGGGDSPAAPDRDRLTPVAEAPEASATDVSFGGTTFTLPAGWSEQDRQDLSWPTVDGATGGVAGKHPYSYLCVGPADAADAADCALRLYHGDVPGHEGFTAWEDHGAWPWHTSTDVPSCPVPSADPAAPFDGVRPVDGSYLPVDSGFRPVGDRSAVYDQWAVECELSGHGFTPRSWHLPESSLVIVDMLGQPETESVLASFRFG
jgi:hypothetical protein